MGDERETYFNAATPGSVAFPAAPITGKSSLSPFRYEHKDGHVIVFDVPLMDEHEDPARRKPFNKFKGRLFDDVVQATKEFEDKGAYCSIIIGHTEGEGDDEFTHPVVGHCRNVKQKGRKEGNRQIVADMWFREADFEKHIKTNKFPRRSAEISRVDFRMDPVALLGASTPARPLPDMLFQKQGGENEIYMASRPNIGDEDMSAEVLEAIKAIDERFSKRLDALEKFQSESDDDDEAKKKKEKEKKEADDEKEKNAADDDAKDDDDTKDKSRSQGEKETFAALNHKVDKLSESVTALTNENTALRAQRITDEIDQKVVFFKRVGIELGDEEKVEKFKKSLAKLDENERQDRYEEVEEHYGRVPVGVRIDRGDVDGGTQHARMEDPVDVAEKKTILCQKYSAECGIGMQEALDIYDREGQTGLEKFKKSTAKA